MGFALADSVCDKAERGDADAEEHQNAAGVEDTGHGQDVDDRKKRVKERYRDRLPKLKTDSAEDYIKRAADDGENRRDKALFSCNKHCAEDDATKRGH